MRAGIIRLTYTMLETLLHLPDGVHINRTFEYQARWRDNTIALVVTGDAVPFDVPEGIMLPYISLWHQVNSDGTITCTLHGD